MQKYNILRKNCSALSSAFKICEIVSEIASGCHFCDQFCRALGGLSRVAALRLSEAWDLYLRES